jgi:hypothetical protein
MLVTKPGYGEQSRNLHFCLTLVLEHNKGAGISAAIIRKKIAGDSSDLWQECKVL